MGGSNIKRRVKRENVKKKERRGEVSDSSSEDEEKERPPSPRKTRSGGSGAVEEGKEPVPEKMDVKAEIKVEEAEADGVNVEEVETVKVEKKTARAAPAKLEIVIPKEEVKKEEVTESAVSPMKSPDIGSPSSSLLKSPGKPALGLPDQSGLIVGVNTINYDVSFRNKAKTREEKKMEMILKAIEQMERTEARKRNENCDSSSEKPEKKRRRSNSIKTNKDLNNVDSNLDASSADESCSTGGSKPRAGKGRGKRSGGLAARRRSRAKSGDSSALSDAEGTDTAGAEESGPPREFKFPRHKRHTVFPDAGDVDDDVSRQYLRGSRSPPGIANHLLRSSSGGSKVGQKHTICISSLTLLHITRCLTILNMPGSQADRAPPKVPQQFSQCRQWQAPRHRQCRRRHRQHRLQAAVPRSAGYVQQCAKIVLRIR